MTTIDPITTADELRQLLARFPNLGYEGWRISDTPKPLHERSREKLSNALDAAPVAIEPHGLIKTFVIAHGVQIIRFQESDRGKKSAIT